MIGYTNMRYQQITNKRKVSYQQVYQWVCTDEAGGDALRDRRGCAKSEVELSLEEI